MTIYEFLEIQKQSAPVEPEPPNSKPAQMWAERCQLPYRVGSSDRLNVALTGLNADIPTEVTLTVVRVDRDGEISLPLVGNVKVGGLELEDVETAIHDAYVPAYFQNGIIVHVEVAEYHTTNVVVVGAVTTPGIIPLRRTERDVLHAVASAGGLVFTASGRMTLKRLRRPDEPVTLDLLDPKELEAAFSLEELEPGDIIEVEAATPNTIYVGGLVMVPGPQIFPPGTQVNLLQLLAAAGGVREELYPTDATLVRRLENGSDVQVRIDLNKLRSGEEPNIILAAGDIFWVPETFGTKTIDFLNRNLFFRAGFTASYNVIGNATGIEFLNRREEQSAALTSGSSNSSTLQNRVDPAGFLFPPSP